MIKKCVAMVLVSLMILTLAACAEKDISIISQHTNEQAAYHEDPQHETIINSNPEPNSDESVNLNDEKTPSVTSEGVEDVGLENQPAVESEHRYEQDTPNNASDDKSTDNEKPVVAPDNKPVDSFLPDEAINTQNVPDDSTGVPQENDPVDKPEEDKETVNMDPTDTPVVSEPISSSAPGAKSIKTICAKFEKLLANENYSALSPFTTSKSADIQKVLNVPSMNVTDSKGYQFANGDSVIIFRLTPFSSADEVYKAEKELKKSAERSQTERGIRVYINGDFGFVINSTDYLNSLGDILIRSRRS